MSLLKDIKHPNDIKLLPDDSLDELASEIRSFIIEKVSENGGHLAANLGVVELTMAVGRILIPFVSREASAVSRREERILAMRSIQATVRQVFPLQSEWQRPVTFAEEQRRSALLSVTDQ